MPGGLHSTEKPKRKEHLRLGSRWPDATNLAGGARTSMPRPIASSYRVALAQAARVCRSTRHGGGGVISHARSLPQNSRTLGANRVPKEPFASARQRVSLGSICSAFRQVHQADCDFALTFVPDVIAFHSHPISSVQLAVENRPNRREQS